MCDFSLVLKLHRLSQLNCYENPTSLEPFQHAGPSCSNNSHNKLVFIKTSKLFEMKCSEGWHMQRGWYVFVTRLLWRTPDC